MNIVENIKNNPSKYKLLTSIYNYTVGRNKFNIRNNKINLNTVLLQKVKIDIKGKNNVIFVDDLSIFNNCNIVIFGNNNNINIGKMCYFKDTEFWIEDDNNSITIKDKTTVAGETQFAAIEGTSISVGNDCLFSSGINIRTGDSHSILDLKGNRINPSKNVMIKDHVWIGNKSMILKGSIISNDSIVSAGAIVTDKFDESNVVIAGVPAKIIKRDINWNKERI